MPTMRRLSGIALLLVLLAGGLCWAVVQVHRSNRSSEIRRATVVQTLAPETVAAAQGKCPIPLPDTASNIQYAVWSFGQVTQSWIRFEAPAADCLKHAERMVEPFRNRDGWTVTTSAISTNTGLLCVLDPTEVDLSWFDLCNFSAGLHFRVDGGRAPMIWVDTNRDCFYCEVKNSRHSMSPK